MMSDALLARCAVDRLTAGAHILIIEGPSYRQRNRPASAPALTAKARPAMLTDTSRWSYALATTWSHSRWQATLAQPVEVRTIEHIHQRRGHARKSRQERQAAY
jgi:hypothetical protein